MAGMQVLGTTCNISLKFFLSLDRSTEQGKENCVSIKANWLITHWRG